MLSPTISQETPILDWVPVRGSELKAPFSDPYVHTLREQQVWARPW